MARAAAVTATSAAQAPSAQAAAPAVAAAAQPATEQPAVASATPRPSVGKLARVTASRLWRTDTAFATWLADNLDALGEALSVRFADGRMPHAETPVVMATDAAGAPVVVVCELGDASDAGFGRLVRNVAASSAKHAVWVCGEPGDEYGASVSWLNRAVDARVTMVKVGGVTIGESAAAPVFEVRVRSPRGDDDGVDASVPDADPTAPAPTTRRVDDWLKSVGAGEDAG
jgi:hypothetical protein